MCPQNLENDSCGPTQHIYLNYSGIDAGQTSLNLTISKMRKGQVCTYFIHTQCGTSKFCIDKDADSAIADKVTVDVYYGSKDKMDKKKNNITKQGKPSFGSKDDSEVEFKSENRGDGSGEK